MKSLKVMLVAVLLAACFASVLTSDRLSVAGAIAEQSSVTAQLGSP